jgi:hypothetical protein
MCMSFVCASRYQRVLYYYISFRMQHVICDLQFLSGIILEAMHEQSLLFARLAS